MTLLLYGCSGEPKVNFDEPVKGKFLDLTKAIGDSIFVTENIDSLKYAKYSFIYDGNTNLIIKDNIDTVFIGTATKRKELILLNRELENGKYAIHAIKLTDSTIKGLETEWIQSVLIDSITKSPIDTKTITDTNQIKTININKKEAKDIFRWVVEQLEPLYIINPHKNSKSDLQKKEIVIEEETNTLDSDKIITSVYPNPFQTTLTIETNINSSFLFQFFNSNGEELITEQRSGQSFVFDLSNEQNGLIYLTVINQTGKNHVNTENVKLIKK